MGVRSRDSLTLTDDTRDEKTLAASRRVFLPVSQYTLMMMMMISSGSQQLPQPQKPRVVVWVNGGTLRRKTW